MATDEPPESPVITTWKSALASLRKSLSKKDFEQIQQSTSPQDVLNYIESVQLKEEGIHHPKILVAIQACALRLQKFSGALDMLAQTGARPGCLVWGSIKFALTIVSNNFEESERLLKALVLIGDCLPRVEIYNKIFLSSSTVQAHVHGIYVTVLDFWARAIKFYKRRKLWKLVRSSWHDYDVEFGNLETTLHRHQDGLEKAAIAQHISDYHADSAEYKEKFKAIATVNTSMARKEIVQWLAPIEYEAEYYMEDLEHARKLRHPGTCEWIRAQSDFRRWSESTASKSLLWIYAIPGAGKTVLSSFLIDHAASFGFRSFSTVFYFFFKNTDYDKNSITAAARSLLYQLYKTRGSTDAALVDDIKKHVDSSGQSHAKGFKTLWNLFCEHAAKLSDLMIVIDALDECIEPRFFIRGLQQLSNDSKIVVTSRREKELVKDLRDWMPMEMSIKEVTADIAAFLEHKVSKSPKLSHPLVRSSVLKLLQSRSNGMFLWVAFMIKDLKTKASVYEIQETLAALPEGLDKMYEKILRRLDTSLKPSPKQLCLRVLKWVVCAIRPLRLQELEEALKLEYTVTTSLFDVDNALLYTQRDIELACGSLLTVRSGTVQLIHLSAREFLQNSSIRIKIDQELQQYLVDVPSVSPQIASRCVSYLLSQCAPPKSLAAHADRSAKHDVDVLKQDSPLLEYACFNWLQHLTQSIEVPPDEEANMIESFLESHCCLGWIHSCFSLDGDCSFRLQIDIRGLLDWARFCSDRSGLSGAQSVLVQVARQWAEGFRDFITGYGDVFKNRPLEVYFVDPERIFGSQRSIFRNDLPVVACERHVVLDEAESRDDEAVPISEHYRLPQYTGRSEDIGFFYLDLSRDVFYLIDQCPEGPPRVFVQERSTGRRLPPLTDPELDHVDARYYFLHACISNDEQHLAVCFRRTEYTYTAVWAIAKTLVFEGGHRTTVWGRKLFSSIGTGWRGFPGRPIVFAGDGSLCYPSGRVTLSTGEVRPLASKLLDWQVFGYSEDGKSLCLSSWDKNRGTRVELFATEGENLNSFALSGMYPSIHYYCSDCGFIIYSSHTFRGHRILLLDLRTGTTRDLDISLISAATYLKFKFTLYDKDKLLGIVTEYSGEKPQIFVWIGIPLQPCLWARKELAYEVMGHFLDVPSLLLYVVSSDRLWGRISLESFDLVNMDLHMGHQTKSYPLRVEYCSSRDGKKLAILKCWKLRASIQVLDPDQPKKILRSSIDMPAVDVCKVNILFSPDLELLLIDNLLYHLNCIDLVHKLVPKELPNLSSNYKIDDGPQPTCQFSPLHDYVAIVTVSRLRDEPKRLTLHVYHISCDSGEITELDISLDYLETLTGSNISGLGIDFHPARPKLGVVCWADGEILGAQVKFLVFNLPSMGLKSAQPGLEEKFSWIGTDYLFTDGLARFSGCGHYVKMSDHFCRHIFPLKCSQVDLSSPCSKPLTIDSNYHSLLRNVNLNESASINCFLNVNLYTEKQNLMAEVASSKYGDDDEIIETLILTTCPARLRNAKFTLFLGEEEDSNLRVIFWNKPHPPEIKFLNFTWADFLSRCESDFSTKFPVLRESPT